MHKWLWNWGRSMQIRFPRSYLSSTSFWIWLQTACRVSLSLLCRGDALSFPFWCSSKRMRWRDGSETKRPIISYIDPLTSLTRDPFKTHFRQLKMIKIHLVIPMKRNRILLFLSSSLHFKCLLVAPHCLALFDGLVDGIRCFVYGFFLPFFLLFFKSLPVFTWFTLDRRPPPSDSCHLFMEKTCQPA